MGRHINCQYCSDFFHCNHPKSKKILGIFPREGIELRFRKTCKLAKRFLRPNLSKILRRK